MKEADIDFLNRPTKEYIICAAIWFKDGKVHGYQPKNIETGFVVCGRRHHNCFITTFILFGEKITDDYNELKGNAEQGFVTSSNRFLDRDQAAQLAFDCGQVNERFKILFSEHIY